MSESVQNSMIVSYAAAVVILVEVVEAERLVAGIRARLNKIRDQK